MTDKIEPKVSEYNSHGVKTEPPAAAKFNQGATTIPQIEQAANARREHSQQLSIPSREGK